jgi:pimeloyl-ACP methyl ester carboxylesterase
MSNIRPRSKFIELNGIRIHYLEWGEIGDPDVVLIHGWTGSALSWSYIAERIHGQYHVIAPDHRGHGDSDKPATGYRLRDFAEDIHQLIAELGLRRPFYAGNSWGGCIGTIMAADYSEDISKAFLGDPVYWRLLNAFTTNLPIVLNWRKLSDDEISAEMRQQGVSHEEILNRLDAIHKFSEQALIRLLTDNRDFAFECENLLRRIKVPTQNIVADSTAGGYILKEEADYLEKIASPTVRFCRWKDVGHGVSSTQPERYIQEMLAFFKE